MSEYPQYIKASGIFYKAALATISKKSDSPLQPVFEAFTNSFESIKILNKLSHVESNNKILINLVLGEDKKLIDVKKDVPPEYIFKKVEIIDTGIGFNDEEYNRFITLRDNRKNFSNRGTGRIQFLHTFNTTTVCSIYEDSNSSTNFKCRNFTLSKSEEFLKENAIVRLDKVISEIESDSPETIVTLENPFSERCSKFFETLSADDLKEELIHHYLVLFCENRQSLPAIIIQRIVDDKVIDKLTIQAEEIPVPDKDTPISIPYSMMSEDDGIVKIADNEKFKLKSFVIPKGKLEHNELKLVSKGELAKNIKLDSLLPDEQIDGKRYLFLLSGNYLNERDSDDRGNINLVSKKEFKDKVKNAGQYDLPGLTDKEIIFEDIEEQANTNILSLYEEIRAKMAEKKKTIDELQEMFLLNESTLRTLKNKIKLNDTDDSILRKVYQADAEILAKKDAEIKKQLEELQELDPTEDDYQDKLVLKTNEFVKAIPLQNRTALTHYVARRRLVLDLFDKIMRKELDKLQDGQRINENLLHNLIFQQSSSSPEDSDLWLINEECIYFKGVSETPLNLLEFDGRKIFNKKFTEEETAYLDSLGENRLRKRPDILLFPAEDKCIIIEFKAPDVNVSHHLSQVDFYANLIRNYTTDDVKITTFYGYLIGESIEDRDVRGHVSSFEKSHHFNYWFRPSEKVTGFDGKDNGSIYTEVIKYSSLLGRARLRNEIFIKKLESER